MTDPELPKISGDHQWTGAEVREWAEILAARLDSGAVTMTMDFERYDRDHDDWTLHVIREGEHGG